MRPIETLILLAILFSLTVLLIPRSRRPRRLSLLPALAALLVVIHLVVGGYRCQMDENFHQTIRIAALDGQGVSEFRGTAFYEAAEVEKGNWIKPVGRLNDDNLLVQIVGAEKPHDGAVVRLQVTTGELSLFARGFLASWFYPG